ncbi:hypothetical protein [Paracoccus sp. (in: a-proteobacteria)]|uniref:hypothetical protein n=1 Tax=Paracoccus sp. TaxID=267 RepID=UPI002AFEE94C|nr:hypothetical protein [Paracoccus sp. (in: a-proteobacteria)]
MQQNDKSPDRIWAQMQPYRGLMTWYSHGASGGTEYRRSDLCASGQQVRALEWGAEAKFSGQPAFYADSEFGVRMIVDHAVHGNGIQAYDEAGDSIGVYPDFEAAKAAAQADYERRILAALTPAPQPEGLDALKISPEYQALFDEVKQRAQPEGHPDDLAVDRFAAAMKTKLAKKRGDGRSGWDRKDECSAEDLTYMLVQHLWKGDPLDVGNLAMMLHQRGERIVLDGEAKNIVPQPAGEVVLVSQDALIDLIGELGREVFHLLDDCETSGPVGEEIHTITDESLTKVSAILDRIDALPFEEPGVILGTGAMLQAAIKQTFQTHSPQPSVSVAEAIAAIEALNVIKTGPWCGGYISRKAALRALKGESDE